MSGTSAELLEWFFFSADQFRGRIRRIARDRTVTTLFGQRNIKATSKVEFPWVPPSLKDEGNWHIHEVAKQTNNVQLASVLTRLLCFKAVFAHRPTLKVTAGSDPDIFIPHTIRVTSKGNLIVLSLGFGVIREINVNTGATVRPDFFFCANFFLAQFFCKF